MSCYEHNYKRRATLGKNFSESEFKAGDYKLFQKRLDEQLTTLKSLLDMPCFNRPQYSLGAELEMYLVDKSSLHPRPVNQQLVDAINHPQLQVELNQFNLEFNSQPVDAHGFAIADLEKELRAMLVQIQEHATDLNTQIVPIGILPTLKQHHLNPEYMTDVPRYHSLAQSLLDLRNGLPFEININGTEAIQISSKDVTLEGANTSLQVHLRVPASSLATVFNAAQLTTPLVLALSANSPLLAEKCLWQETRVPLFKQSIDSRINSNCEWRVPSRVTFGHGWLRNKPWEQFAEHIALFPPLFPVAFEPEQGEIPKLEELCLHHGTVWSWNRCVYSHADGGHVRIEFRSLPAGPTVADMMANIALSIGLALGFEDSVEEMLYQIPFRFAEYNFYRAAQHGLDAKILWPQAGSVRAVEQPITEIISSVLPIAEKGLVKFGLNSEEINRLLSIIKHRLANKQNGACWQTECLAKLESKLTRQQALHQMMKRYIANVIEGNPVSQWQV